MSCLRLSWFLAPPRCRRSVAAWPRVATPDPPRRRSSRRPPRNTTKRRPDPLGRCASPVTPAGRGSPNRRRPGLGPNTRGSSPPWAAMKVLARRLVEGSTRSTASPSKADHGGKASRKNPDTRQGSHLIHGRPDVERMTSSPVTRPVSSAHTGRTPIRPTPRRRRPPRCAWRRPTRRGRPTPGIALLARWASAGLIASVEPTATHRDGNCARVQRVEVAPGVGRACASSRRARATPGRQNEYDRRGRQHRRDLVC